LRYKDKDLMAVWPESFADDYGINWTAAAANRSWLVSGWSNRQELISHVDYSDRLRFNYSTVLVDRLEREYKAKFDDFRWRDVVKFDRTIGFESNLIRGVIGKFDRDFLEVAIAPVNAVSHIHRDDFIAFYNLAEAIEPLPTTESNYQKLVDRIDEEIICA
jgi:hypothetical protein